MKVTKKEGWANLKNSFVIRANHDLSTLEQKLIYHLISKINSKNQKDFAVRRVKVSELEREFSDKNNRNFYARLRKVCKSIMSKPIVLPKGFIIDGKVIELDKLLHWFTDIEPMTDEEGDLILQFRFHDLIKPYLLSLSQNFVQIDVKNEYFPFIGKYALNLYPAFKARRNEDKANNPYSTCTVLSYGIDEFKAKLGLQDGYKAFKNLRRRVIEPMIKEINEKSSLINITCDYVKNGRSIVVINFHINDVVNVDVEKLQTPKKKKSKKDYIPTAEDIAVLSWSKKNAYDTLIEFGVKEGIAIKQIVEKVKGGNMEGFEDLFIRKSLEHFKKWAKQQENAKQSAGTFVNWWTKQKVFANENDVFWKIAEAVNVEKKDMEQDRIDNRMIAKDMNKADFVKWYNENHDIKR